VIKNLRVALAVAALILVLSSQPLTRALWAEGIQRPILITEPIDESRLVTLAGNTRFEATARNDRGPVPDSFPLDHMLLQLRRAPALERQFDRHVDSLTDKTSPNFRQWMTAAEQGEKYGLAQQDINTITGWLASQGFKVGYVYPNLMVIDFSGTAGQIREAFHTEIHYLEVNGEAAFRQHERPENAGSAGARRAGRGLSPRFQASPDVHGPHELHFCRVWQWRIPAMRWFLPTSRPSTT
jgi:hypothetical protein